MMNKCITFLGVIEESSCSIMMGCCVNCINRKSKDVLHFDASAKTKNDTLYYVKEEQGLIVHIIALFRTHGASSWMARPIARHRF